MTVWSIESKACCQSRKRGFRVGGGVCGPNDPQILWDMCTHQAALAAKLRIDGGIYGFGCRD